MTEVRRYPEMEELIKEVIDHLDFPVEIKSKPGAGAYRFDFSEMVHRIDVQPHDPEGLSELFSKAWACEWIHPTLGFFYFDTRISRKQIQKVVEELKVASSWIIDHHFFKKFPIALKIAVRGMKEEFNAALLSQRTFKRIPAEAFPYLGFLGAWMTRYGEMKEMSAPFMDNPLVREIRSYLLKFNGPWNRKGFIEIANRILEIQDKKLRVSYSRKNVNPRLAPLTVTPIRAR